MRFHFGPIPNDFIPDASWRPLQEPSPLVAQLLALPIGFGIAAMVGYCWYHIAISSWTDFQWPTPLALLVFMLVSFPVLIVLHELLHASMHPGRGRSSATVIGFWPSKLMFYAHYSGPIIRNQFLAVFAAPLVIISLLPLVIAAAKILPPLWLLAAAWLSTWNALFACIDCLAVVTIWAQVPCSAILRNQGWFTYWKPI